MAFTQYVYEFNIDLFSKKLRAILLRVKNERGIGMDLDEERVNMMAHAAGRAVMELSLADIPVTQEAIIEKLEQYRRETGNVIGKGINRDADEIVRKGSKAVK
ncbi:TPA: hypothetical protein ACI4GT_002925 [Enterobacter hormaechei]